MYTFVFLWTPALSSHGGQISHGFVFSCFMIACMCGSAMTGYLMANGYKPEIYMKYVFAMACAALVIPALVLIHEANAPKGDKACVPYT